MPTFSQPDAFKDHKQYIALLKKALLTVKPEGQKKFLYFKQYAFGPKKLPLVLVDFDSRCAGDLAQAGAKPSDEGTVSLTPEGELNFEPKRGALKRLRLKKYFATMGGGIKPVFVPAGETDDEGETEPGSDVPPAPPLPGDPNAAKKGELLARIDELQAKAFSPTGEALKKQVLEKARVLVDATRFADAGLLLDKLAAQVAVPARQPGSKVQFEKAHLDWDAQKKGVESRLAELNKAILADFADAEGTTAAKNLSKVLARFNEGLGDTLDDVRNAATPEARAPIVAKANAIADRYLQYLDSDPLVAHVESNPFEIKVDVKNSLSTPLTRLKQQLQQFTA
jgi:hypothetical protein